MSGAKNYIGLKFGKWTVIGGPIRKQSRVLWECQCICGTVRFVYQTSLDSGKSRGCGSHKRMNLKTHGLCGTKLYMIWALMKQRCGNPKNPNYHHYGGRNIKVCEEWEKDYVPFYNWSMSHGYKEGLSIDRINVNGDYTPDNCRWTDWETQSNNKRDNVFMEYNGERHTLSEWSKASGIDYQKVRHRFAIGYPPEIVLYKGNLNTKPGFRKRLFDERISNKKLGDA